MPQSEALLIKNEGEVRYVACPAGVEWRDSPAESALFSIHHLLIQLASKEGLPSPKALMSRVDRAAIAVAGTDSRFSSTRFLNALQQAGFPQNVMRLTSLSEAAHLGCFLGRPGILVRCGHGSSVFVKGNDGKTSLVGGWGGMVGDHGSGAWIGKKALAAVARAVDGSASSEETQFAQALVQAAVGLESVPLTYLFEEMEVSRSFGGNLAVRIYLTKLASNVLGLAESGDACAAILADRAQQHLVAMVGTALSKTCHDGSLLSIGLRGSLFTSHQRFAGQVLQKLTREHKYARIPDGGSNGRHSPLVGLGLLALNCSEPDEIASIGEGFLASVSQQDWARSLPDSLAALEM